MRNALLIVLSLLFLGSTNAQDYESIFGDQSTQWNITLGNLWGMSTAEHMIIGDTTIDNLNYKIVGGYDGLSATFGFLRQDSTHAKAWYRNTLSDREYLVLDLNMNVGDSMYIGGNWTSEPGYHFVDSVYIENGRKHIRFDLEIGWLNNEKFTMIEGITSNLGYRHQNDDYVNVFPMILLCAFKDDVQVYGIGDCVISSVSEQSPSAEIEVYPNPFKKEITIDYEGSHGVLFVTIYDLSGRKLLSAKTNGPESNTIDLRHLNAGLYIVNVRDRSGKYNYTTRVVKSDY
jgi:hypothetical protein